eukprot:COSAG02_NODE_36528_length_453_cov_1.132768_1_plen_99_part_01
MGWRTWPTHLQKNATGALCACGELQWWRHITSIKRELAFDLYTSLAPLSVTSQGISTLTAPFPCSEDSAHRPPAPPPDTIWSLEGIAFIWHEAPLCAGS